MTATQLTRARSGWIGVAAVVAMFASLAAEQQQQPTRDPGHSPASRAASIVGVVVQDDESGRPVRRASVHLSSPSVRTPRMTMTDDAGRFGILPQDWVHVESQRGQVRARAFVTATIQSGQVFIPMHYNTANLLTDAVFDPYSRQPSYKACAVRVSRA